MSGNTSIDRRQFVTGAASGSVAMTLGARAAGEPAAPVRAAVLEHRDRWSEESTGVAELLARSGVQTRDLDTARGADAQPTPPDLIAFGSFTNNDGAYGRYVSEHAESLRAFVRAGGVVLEMTQSDQFGATVPYLPEGMLARRGDRDLDPVFGLDREHPLVAPWYPDGARQVDGGFFDRKHPNWESFDEWAGLRVLLASELDGRSPCLLEGAHGRGRFVLSSLWIDKCFGPGGGPTGSPTAVERGEAFFAAVAGYVQLVRAGRAPQVVPTPMLFDLPTGPMIGHVDAESARLWIRPAEGQRRHRTWSCALEGPSGEVHATTSRLDADHDFTAHFEVGGLSAATTYRYAIAPRPDDPGTAEAPAAGGTLRTAPDPSRPRAVTLGLGSCAPSDPSHIWTRVLDEGCEGFVFLGDTPYVDSGDLATARERHRQFLAQPEIREMVGRIPCWGTWDDHDFGLNDGHGDFPGKHVCRTAFTEYRANATFGHDEEGDPQPRPFGDGRGIYTSFRHGPIEVFLIDPRWFSRTEPSFADPSQPTCLGARQWAWLQRGLEASTATFKALATGMIWDDKQNSERDDWHTYAHEREAILDFIEQRRIGGCFLIGGDIHVSRALNYGPRVGYDLWQFIVSPMHGSTIAGLDVPHPALVHHALEPFVFLVLRADTTVSPATLSATWVNRDGREVFAVSTTEARMRPA